MSGEALASFRELQGVGPATEARLHESGVYTWTALSAVLHALVNVRGISGDKLRKLSEHAAGLAAEPGADMAPGAPDPERAEAFILRLSLAPDGRAARSSVTHVRSQTERQMAGWAPDDLIRFVEEQTGLAGAARPEPAARDHHVVLDAGKAVGGGRRSVDLTLANAIPADAGEFEYRATLAGRAYGDAARERRWTTIAREAGRGTPAETLPLRFPEVDLPAGIHRLRLDMALRFENPVSAAPALELV